MRIENEKRKEETKLILRVYKPADCKALTELFYETVHSVNTKDYTKEQVDAWADGNVDLEKWNQSFLEHYTVIAEEENGIIGFGDLGISVTPAIWTGCMFTKRISIRESLLQSVTSWSIMQIRMWLKRMLQSRQDRFLNPEDIWSFRNKGLSEKVYS